MMPISGLVITLSDEQEARDGAVAAIAADSRVEVGESHPRRMAIVMETRTSDEDRLFWQWINDLYGVEFVEVAFIGFDEGATELPAAQFSKP